MTRGEYNNGYVAGLTFNLKSQKAKIAAERERCIQLFLAYAFDDHGWKLKDGEADRVRVMLEDLRSGAEVFEPFVFLETDPDNFDMPSIRLLSQVKTSQESAEPTPEAQISKPKLD